MAISTRTLRRAATMGMLLMAIALAAACGKAKTAAEYIEDAKKHRAAGELPAALIDLKNALQRDAKNTEARVLLGRFYLDVPDATSAEAALLRARQDGADPTIVAQPLAEAELLLGKPQTVLKETELSDAAPAKLKAGLLAERGQALLALGRVDEANRTLQAGLEADAQSIDVLAALVRNALAVHDLTTAQARLAQAKALDPDNFMLLSLEGTVTFAAGDFAASERAFQRMHEAAKWNLSARLGMARAQIALDKLKDADANLAVVLKAAPTDPNANYLRAVLSYRQQDYTGALSHIERTLNAAKDFEPALLLAGASSLALKQYEQANAYLGRYVYLVPNNVQARKLLAAVQVQLGHPADAVKVLSQAAAQNTGDAQLLGLVGIASAQAGDLVAADRYLKLALTRSPDNAKLRAQLAMTQIALGDTEAGIDELERSSREDPTAIRPEIVLFIAYLRNNDFSKALDVAERVQSQHPTDATGFDLAGLAHFAKGESAAARTAFLKARQFRPGDPLALRSLAAMAIRGGNLNEAAQYYQEALKADPRNAQAYIGLAELKIRGGSLDEAENLLKTAVQSNPESISARVVLGRLLLSRGQSREALSIVEPALSRSPEDPSLLEIEGSAQLAMKDADAAAGTFRSLVRVQPQASIAHRYLAQAYAASGNVEFALTEAQKATGLDPKDAAAKMLLARLYLAKRDYSHAGTLANELAADYAQDAGIAELQGEVAMAQHRPRDAVTAFQRGLAIGDSSRLRSHLAIALVSSGRPEEAEKTLLPWIASHPDDAAARLSMGDIYMGQNRLDEALTQYAAVVEEHPRNATAENNLAWVLSLKGQNGEALEHARRAANLAPNAPEVLDTLGVVLLQNQNTAEAVSTLQRAAALAPVMPEIQFHLARALAKAGNKEGARELLRTLLAKSQSFNDRAQAQKLLQDLGS